MSRARDLSNFVNPAAISVDGSFNVGINSQTPDVKLDVVGVVSATSFTGDGANISNVSATTATNAEGLTGTPDIAVRNVTGVAATFTGNVSISGTVTYEDVTNVDSIGIITARQGVHFGTAAAGTLVEGDATGIGIGTDNPATKLSVLSTDQDTPSLTWNGGGQTIIGDNTVQLAFGRINANPFPMYLQGRASNNVARDIVLVMIVTGKEGVS